MQAELPPTSGLTTDRSRLKIKAETEIKESATGLQGCVLCFIMKTI